MNVEYEQPIRQMKAFQRRTCPRLAIKLTLRFDGSSDFGGGGEETFA
jgi:hypothetical protein